MTRPVSPAGGIRARPANHHPRAIPDARVQSPTGSGPWAPVWSDSYLRVGPHRVHALHWPPVVAPADGRPAPVVVGIHGMVAASRSMLPLGEELARRGCAVWFPDLPGFGYSSRPPYAVNVEEAGDVVAEWARAQGLSGVCLLANSAGCQPGAALLQRHPDLASCAVFVSPAIPPGPRQRGLRVMPFLRLFPGRRGGDRPSRRRPARLRPLGVARELMLRAAYRRLGDHPPLLPLVLWEYAGTGFARMVSTYRYAMLDALEDRLPDIKAPLLVLRGEHDPFVSAEWAEQITRSVADGRWGTLAGADHNAQYLAAGPIAEAVAPFAREHAR